MRRNWLADKPQGARSDAPPARMPALLQVAQGKTALASLNGRIDECRGKVQSIGVGAKDIRVIELIVDAGVHLDWARATTRRLGNANERLQDIRSQLAARAHRSPNLARWHLAAKVGCWQ